MSRVHNRRVACRRPAGAIVRNGVLAVALALCGACMPNVHTLVIAISPKVYVCDQSAAKPAAKPDDSLPTEDELLANLRSFEEKPK